MRFTASLKPLSRKVDTALALRPPDLQWTTTRPSGSSSSRAPGNSPRGISRRPGMAQIRPRTARERPGWRARCPRRSSACNSRNGIHAPRPRSGRRGGCGSRRTARDRRIGAADRAIGISRQLEFAKAHLEGVEIRKRPISGSPIPRIKLQRLGRLDGADDPGQHAEHAGLGAARHEPGRRRLGVQAAVAGSARSGEDGCLPFEPEDAAPRVGPP